MMELNQMVFTADSDIEGCECWWWEWTGKMCSSCPDTQALNFYLVSWQMRLGEEWTHPGAHELLASFLFLRMQVKSVPEFVLSVKDCKLGLR